MGKIGHSCYLKVLKNTRKKFSGFWPENLKK